MSGTKIGGQKAAATNKAKYGDEFYRIIGSKGGQNGHTGGFTNNPELAKRAGAIGGRVSRRTAESAKPKEYIWRAGDEFISR